MTGLNIKYQKIHPDAKQPSKSHFEDAGWDLYAVEDQWIWPFIPNKIRLGIKIAVPKAHVGLIWDRSGMAIKKSLHRVAGVIDSPYRGEWIVGMLRFFPWPIKIKAGDRVAQVLIQEIPLHIIWEEADLDETNRGDGGFGSTGR